MSVDIKEAILSLLRSDPSLDGVAIRPGRARQSDPYPTLTFRMVTHRRGHVLGGHDGISDDRIQFDATSTNEAQVTAIARSLEALLDGYSGAVLGLAILWVAQEQEVDLDEPAETGTDQYVRRKSIDYRFKYRSI